MLLCQSCLPSLSLFLYFLGAEANPSHSALTVCTVLQQQKNTEANSVIDFVYCHCVAEFILSLLFGRDSPFPSPLFCPSSWITSFLLKCWSSTKSKKTEKSEMSLTSVWMGLLWPIARADHNDTSNNDVEVCCSTMCSGFKPDSQGCFLFEYELWAAIQHQITEGISLMLWLWFTVHSEHMLLLNGGNLDSGSQREWRISMCLMLRLCTTLHKFPYLQKLLSSYTCWVISSSRLQVSH